MRISASPLASTTRVYLVSDWKYSTSSTGMSFTCLPTAALTHFMRPASPCTLDAQLGDELPTGRSAALASLRSMRSTIGARRSVSTGFSR